MDSSTEKLIDDQFKSLPPNFQAAINSVPWKSLVVEIATENKVPQQKIEVIERETMLVIYGFEHIENYIDNLSKESGLTEEVVIATAEEVNKKIFSEISRKAEELEKKPETPIIITQETKKAVIEQLSQRVEAARKGGASVKPPMPKPAPEIHPMIKKGEVAHEVPHEEPTTDNPQPTTLNPIEPSLSTPIPPPPTPVISTPEIMSTPAEPALSTAEPNPTASTELKKPSAPANLHYPGGLDPYREPLQ